MELTKLEVGKLSRWRSAAGHSLTRRSGGPYNEVPEAGVHRPLKPAQTRGKRGTSALRRRWGLT